MTVERSAQDRLGPDACSVTARARRDPCVGSAPPASGWLVFEHPGPWPTTAMDVFGVLGAEISQRCLAQRIRPMLVRRPGRDQDTGGERSWWLVNSVTGRSTRGTWSSPEEVAGALGLVDGATAEIRWDSADPMILVCAHAKHDVCCAVRGRPIAADLAQRWPGLVWECSHLGGDRFAGNIAMLPDSTFYGGLDAANAQGVVADHLSGRIGLQFYRGSGLYAAPVQAVVAEVLRRSGTGALADVAVGHTHIVDEGVWDVEVAGAAVPNDGVATYRVERRWRDPERLTCSGLVPKVAAEFHVRLARDA